MGFPGGAVVKNPPANAGGTETQVGSSLGREDSPGVGNSNSFQYSCLEDSTARGV